MKAVLLAVGDELTCGQVVDTNSAYLAEQLGTLGLEVAAHHTIGDDLGSIVEAIRAAATAAEVVLITGGLGPTADDRTREALASAMCVELELDEGSLARIEELFRRRGRKMAEANRSQALLPQGAEALPNAIGTAPGMAAKVGEAQVFALPGVPDEMRRMFPEQVVPRLPSGRGAIVTKSLHTFGKGESDLTELITRLTPPQPDVSVGTIARAGLVTIKITARAGHPKAARRRLEPICQAFRRGLGNLLACEDDQTLPGVVAQRLKRAGQTLATAESCTGGMVGKMITDVSGSSEYYLGGVVAYADEAKRELLGVAEGLLAEHGAVSEAVAAAMTEGCRRRFTSDWALSLTGIAGPTGGSAEKPVGLVYVGLSGPGGTQVHRHQFPGSRALIRRRSALAALNHLRLALP